MSLSNRAHDDRLWGSEEIFTINEPSTVKLLHVDSGKRFSLQRHKERSEFWRVVEGSGTVRVGDDEHEITIGDEVEIAIGVLHRLTGGPNGITVLEIATGTFDENDIERLEDDFGRV